MLLHVLYHYGLHVSVWKLAYIQFLSPFYICQEHCSMDGLVANEMTVSCSIQSLTCSAIFRTYRTLLQAFIHVGDLQKYHLALTQFACGRTFVIWTLKTLHLRAIFLWWRHSHPDGKSTQIKRFTSFTDSKDGRHMITTWQLPLRAPN